MASIGQSITGPRFHETDEVSHQAVQLRNGRDALQVV